jgi:radical SAM superfamily enzyme YgiQ (UPF0313 family)
MEKNNFEDRKIVLALLPVWDPLIPPVGISALKSYLQDRRIPVQTIDVNVERELGSVHNDYFECLKGFIPREKSYHIYNIGHQVLKGHMMAYFHKKDKKKYLELLRTLVYQTFFHSLEEAELNQLEEIIHHFYNHLSCRFIELLEREKPDILGLSVYGGTLPASLFVSKLTKERCPDTMIVMGGAIFSGELELNSPDFDYFIEKAPFIDKIIVGEGEKLFLKLLKGEFPEDQQVFTIKDLDNETVDISKLRIPDFTDFDLGIYTQMASYTSRSCPFQCTFCVETTYWGKYRKKSAKQIVNELNTLYDKYGKRIFLMCDSLLNPVVSDLAEEFIKGDRSLYWGGYLRVDTHVCDVQKTIRWRQGGFYRARLGLESGSQRILDKMNKKIQVGQVKTALSSLAMAGIKTTAMFVIGYPGETEEEFQQTLRLVEECKDDIYEADCNPFWYFLSGQVESGQLGDFYKPLRLYPEEARELLLLETYILNCEPTREERYRRVNRFIEHCRNLRIPNPYTLFETIQADERWVKLHKNAVPPLCEINDGSVAITETKEVKGLSFAESSFQDNGDWRF